MMQLIALPPALEVPASAGAAASRGAAAHVFNAYQQPGEARNVDAQRERKRASAKKASPTPISAAQARLLSEKKAPQLVVA